ncbi:MAG TPA: hypothetical protein DCP63_03540 [Bacteroidetes bacterium]|nr:hypothetical protein [Bacteroidota bacterium]
MGKKLCHILIVALLLFAGCAGIRIDRSLRPSAYDWMMYGGAPTRVNVTLSRIEPPLESKWEYNALGGIIGQPLVRDSVMIVATMHGELQAVELGTGKRIGYVVLESAVAATPAWDGKYVYVPSALGTETLACIGVERAERKWTAQLGSIESSPLLLGDTLFVASMDGVLHCVDSRDGKVLWKFETAVKSKRKPIRSSPASNGDVIVFGSDDGGVYCVDRAVGRLRWKHQTSGSIFATPIVQDNRVLVGSLDGNLYSLDIHTGSPAWKYQTGSRVYGSAAADRELVVIGSADGRLHALKNTSGERVWTFSAGSVINSAPLIAGDVLYFGSLDRKLYAIQTSSGKELWQHSAEGRIKVSPVLWGKTLLVTSEDKFITAYRSLQNQ